MVNKKMSIVQKSGEAFESRVREILGLFSGSHVLGETLILGKKVDAVCVIQSSLAPPFRIVVECKDWEKPLTRKECAAILSDYAQILEDTSVDQFMLVSVNGIVPNAKEIFDGRRRVHLTLDQLAKKIFDPARLVENTRRYFMEDELHLFYKKPRAQVPPLVFCSKHYDLVYNPFIDFVIQSNHYISPDLGRAGREWLQYTGKVEDRATLKLYSKGLFKDCVSARTGRHWEDLESAVVGWINDEAPGPQLAILSSYGTGKSSFAKRIAYICACDHQNDNTLRIPILIELKEFGSHQDIRGLITHELVNRHGVSNGAFDSFQELNQRGRFVIILDGFDEMKQGMTVDSLLFNFNQLSILAQSKSKIILCGRPTLFESQEEQTALLAGKFSSYARCSAQYIQLEIAPLSVQDIIQTLLDYTAAKNPAVKKRVEKFVMDLQKYIFKIEHQELLDLLARPVHLPMIVSLLQRHPINPKKLNRATLYRDFIDAIIERETLKRRADFQDVYPSQVRRSFAQEIGVEMWRSGEQRSIRIGEIPIRLLQSHVKPGRSIEAVRRDLVAACFFERKPPDILFTPHKSFLE